ncbi:protein jagged-1 [Caerostris extrusa]|uniref:Protein jagged-1 n=1 Tax=Caerostris extrusa TaxID=172846 RepID=A0AAV4NUG8_CAEEX|nr:protein jagged-1 [Caerostris extrusa]
MNVLRLLVLMEVPVLMRLELIDACAQITLQDSIATFLCYLQIAVIIVYGKDKFIQRIVFGMTIAMFAFVIREEYNALRCGVVLVFVIWIQILQEDYAPLVKPVLLHLLTLASPLLANPMESVFLSDNSSEALSQELVPDEECVPNNAVLSNNCAKITLFFDKSKMNYGILVEEICSQVRKLPLTHMLLNNRSKDMVIVLCGVKANEEDSIEVTISTTGKPTIETFHTVSNITKKIADLISRKHHNTTILTGVIEVKVETSMVNADYKDKKNYVPLLVLLLSLLILLIVAGGVFWYYWHHRRKKTNRENNLCRYHNPLQSVPPRDQQCSFVPSGSSEMIDFDPDKADIPTKIYKSKLPEACVNSTISSEKDCEKNNTFRKLSNHIKDKATGAVI